MVLLARILWVEKPVLGKVSDMLTVTQQVRVGTDPVPKPDSRIPTLSSFGHKLLTLRG